MAALPTPRPTPSNRCAAPLAAWRQSASFSLPLAVAFSGGADSTALLLAAHAEWPGQVVALHVHHGLQAAADGFETHCRERCAALGIPFSSARVDARHASGESPEDAARQARYLALTQLATQAGASDVLLAQHADDQAETLLLALSRGAGLPGLAAMAASFERHQQRFHRPILGVNGPAIRAWLIEAGEPYVEDPTNADTGFTRNRIRADVLPALEKAFPQFRETFARSSRHAAQAQALLNEVAEEDLATTGEPPSIKALQKLSRDRQGNTLRHWLRTRYATAPSNAQLEELLGQIAACTTRGHRIHIKVGAGFVVREAEKVTWVQSVSKV